MDGLPIRTPRLVIRMMRVADAEVHTEYRNDPEIARHQLWDLPYPLEAARASFASQADADDIIVGDWTTLAIELDGEVIGDVVTNVDPTGGIAEVGYTLARAHHGRGYAREAAGAVVEQLFRRIGVGRVYGELDPVNVASQRVLEAIGLTFESHTKHSFLWRGEWSDNMSYAATRDEYEEWMARPTTRPDRVELVPIDHGNVARFADLATHHSQQRFVEPMLVNFADALFPELVGGEPRRPWMRGIEADGDAVGFVMIAEASPAQPDPHLWRLLIDRRHQRRGIAAAAVEQVLTQLRADGHRSITTVCVDGPGSPKPFYEALGFAPTGDTVDGDPVWRAALRP